jgi:hypothetical protein
MNFIDTSLGDKFGGVQQEISEQHGWQRILKDRRILSRVNEIPSIELRILGLVVNGRPDVAQADRRVVDQLEKGLPREGLIDRGDGAIADQWIWTPEYDPEVALLTTHLREGVAAYDNARDDRLPAREPDDRAGQLHGTILSCSYG